MEIELYPIHIPAGNDTEVQYNNGGIFGGDSAFTWDDSAAKALTIGNCAVLGSDSAVFQPNADSTTFFQVLDAAGNEVFNVDSTNEAVIIGGTSIDSGFVFQVDGGPTYLAGAASNEILKLGEKTGKQRFLSFQDGTNVQWRVNIQGDDVTRDIPANPSYAMAVDSRLGGAGFSIFRWPPVAGGFVKLFGVNETTAIVQNTGFQYTGTPEFLMTSNSGFHLDSNANAIINLDRGATANAAFIQNQTAGVTDWYIGTQDSDIGAFTGSEYIIGTSFTVPEFYLDTNGLMVLQGTTPYQTILNTTHEDSDSGRESRLNFKGEQSGGEQTTLARIEVSHDGAADDEKGKVVISTNATADGDTPTDQLMVQSTGDWVVNKTSGIGIKVDLAAPTFGFADLLGDQFSKNTGGTKPTLVAYNGAVDAWQFSNGDEAFLTYHIPHDYVPGTDIHLHVHWSQNNAGATGGTIDFKYFAIYAKGHNQVSGSTFTAVPITATFSSIDINDGGSGLNQYQQHLTEVTISAATATAALFDRDDFEPDGVIELTLEMDATNLTGTPSDPFIHYADIHYQTNGIIGTKNRTPNFYS